jgi:hypothetical protein
MTVTSRATADAAAGADTTEHSQDRPLPPILLSTFFAAQFPDPGLKVVTRR